MIMIGTIIGLIRIAMINRRYGISGRLKPSAAIVPKTVARIVDQNPTISEFFAAFTQVALFQASAHQLASRTFSGVRMPSVKSESYHRSE